MAGSRTAVFDLVLKDNNWKKRVNKENLVQRYQWPEIWGFQVDEYNKLEAAARGNDPNSVVPSGIKPLNLIEAAEYKKPLDASLYLRTTSGLIGYSKADKREKSEMAELQRQARPQGDIRKSFGWPPDAD